MYEQLKSLNSIISSINKTMEEMGYEGFKGVLKNEMIAVHGDKVEINLPVNIKITLSKDELDKKVKEETMRYSLMCNECNEKVSTAMFTIAAEGFYWEWVKGMRFTITIDPVTGKVNSVVPGEECKERFKLLNEELWFKRIAELIDKAHPLLLCNHCGKPVSIVRGEHNADAQPKKE